MTHLLVSFIEYGPAKEMQNLTIHTIGPFGGSTKNPILFISNTLDPITLFSGKKSSCKSRPDIEANKNSGEKGARIFHGAEFLTTEGTAVSYSSNTSLLNLQRLQHTSLASSNQCEFAKINRFFQTGALPGNDNYCPVEHRPHRTFGRER